jgi:hypothetical protein
MERSIEARIGERSFGIFRRNPRGENGEAVAAFVPQFAVIPRGKRDRAAARNLNGDLGGSRRGGQRGQQMPAYFQKLFAVAVGEKSKVADADKALGEHVQEEAAPETRTPVASFAFSYCPCA